MRFVILPCTMIVFIKEKSRLAKWAARKLRSQNAAIVVKNTIYLWGASREDFLRSPGWVRHEVAHVYQYQQLGMMRFLWFYLYQTARNGYYNNRFEREARSHENDARILDGITFR